MTESSDSAPQPPGRRRLVLIVLFLLVLAGAGGAIWWMRDSAPLLDGAILAEHHERWMADPLEDYDLVLVVHLDGQDEQRHELEVRGSEVVSQTLDGRLIARPGDGYSIRGLYNTLEEEIELAKKHRARGATTLRARFLERPVVPVIFKRLTTRVDANSVVIRVDSLSVPDVGLIYPVPE